MEECSLAASLFAPLTVGLEYRLWEVAVALSRNMQCFSTGEGAKGVPPVRKDVELQRRLRNVGLKICFDSELERMPQKRKENVDVHESGTGGPETYMLTMG